MSKKLHGCIQRALYFIGKEPYIRREEPYISYIFDNMDIYMSKKLQGCTHVYIHQHAHMCATLYAHTCATSINMHTCVQPCMHTRVHPSTCTRLNRYHYSCISTFSLTRIVLQHTATHCNTLQHTATHCNTLATHCNTLRHTATHQQISRSSQCDPSDDDTM